MIDARSVPVRPDPAWVRPAPGPESVEVLTAELVEVSRQVYDRGLTIGVCGNASVRVPGLDAALIKATGVCMGAMTARDAVLVSLDGEILAGGSAPPSKEVGWHVGIYRSRADVDAVVHAHPAYATAWASAGRVPPRVHSAARDLVGPIELVDFATPGSPELDDLVIEAFSRPAVDAALLVEHGIVTVGASLRDAYHLAEHVEDAARAALLTGMVHRLDEG